MKKGTVLSKQYTLQSDYQEMKAEYERVIRDKAVDSSIKFQRKALVFLISGIELVNKKVDLGAKLEGWSESVNEDIDSYDEIFEELYDKYKGKSSLPPEARLLLSVLGSGFMFHLSNSMFKNAMPNFEDVMKKNPALMRQVAGATAKTMGDNMKQDGNPLGGLMGMFGNFMNPAGAADNRPSGMQTRQEQKPTNNIPNMKNLFKNDTGDDQYSNLGQKKVISQSGSELSIAKSDVSGQVKQNKNGKNVLNF